MSETSIARRSDDRDLARMADDQLIADALRVLEQRARYGSDPLSNPADVKAYLRLRLGLREYEVFAVVFLTSQHRVIEVREMFRGTLTQTAVYPREVVKAAMELNAGAVILAHNHPSGTPEPSRADEFITTTLKQALALVDVRVIDHIVVTAHATLSFAERGLI